jgi:PAS domain S-box-containing protein
LIVTGVTGVSADDRSVRGYRTMSRNHHVLCVGEKSSLSGALAAIDGEFDASRLGSAAELFEMLPLTTASCVLASTSVSDCDILALLDAVRERSPDVPFVALDETGDPELAAAVLARDGTDYVDARAETYRPELAARRVEAAAARYRTERTAEPTAGAPSTARTAEIEASREKYRRLVETAPDAIFIVDAETGRIRDTNEAAEALLCKPREEIVGMHQTELHPPSERERYRRLFEAHVEGGGATRVDDDFDVVRDDGREIPVEISAGITEIGDRTLNQAVFRDITERKQREATLEALREVTRDLLAAETKPEICEIAVEAAQDVLELPISGIHLLDEDGTELRPVAVTDEAEQLFDGVPSFAAGEGLVWQVYRAGDARLYEDVGDRPDAYNPRRRYRPR